MKYTKELSDNIQKLKEALNGADVVIIGAGAGLSASAGFSYSGERFNKYFPDFIKKYGFSDMYTGGFYNFDTPEEYWGYWSRYIYVNRYMNAPRPVYENLLSLVKNKDYFVITTNVDHCFQKAGFDKSRLFYTQGDYGLFQCSVPCSNVTYDNEKYIKEMVKNCADMKVPSELIPSCPRCGKPLTVNLRADDKFVEDEGWRKAALRYENFVNSKKDGRVLFLELGVGFNTQTIIKYPFWELSLKNPKAVYASVNLGEALVPGQLEPRSICINCDIGEIISSLL